MKNINHKNGFTLLEVLIALVILSISMLGVYSLLKTSIDTNIYARDKYFVIERAYDRISRQISYPNKIYEEVEIYDGIEVRYKFEREATQIPTVQEVRMTVATDKAEIVFVYYEETGSF